MDINDLVNIKLRYYCRCKKYFKIRKQDTVYSLENINKEIKRAILLYDELDDLLFVKYIIHKNYLNGDHFKAALICKYLINKYKIKMIQNDIGSSKTSLETLGRPNDSRKDGNAQRACVYQV